MQQARIVSHDLGKLGPQAFTNLQSMIQLLIAYLCFGVFGAQMLLDDARDLIRAMPFTQAQRIQIANAATNVLKVSIFN